MVRTSNERVRVNVYFDGKVLDALRRMAVAKNMTYSELIRQATRAYVLEHGSAAASEVSKLRELSK